MSKSNYVFLLILLFLLQVGCTDENIQPESFYSKDDISVKKDKVNHYVPFKSTFEISVDLNSVLSFPPNELPVSPYPPTPPPNIPFKKYQEVFGNGFATHLGKTDVKLEQWWRPTLNPPPPRPGDPFHQWSGTGCGEIYFTASNGDILLADYNDAIAVHLAPDYVETTLTGYFKDGGTGRFANVEGWFQWDVEYYPVTNIGTIKVIGEIMYHK